MNWPGCTCLHVHRQSIGNGRHTYGCLNIILHSIVLAAQLCTSSLNYPAYMHRGQGNWFYSPSIVSCQSAQHPSTQKSAALERLVYKCNQFIRDSNEVL